MTDRVHIITLITGEYSDVSRQVVGAYLDYNKALARKDEVDRLIEKHQLTAQAVRARTAELASLEDDIDADDGVDHEMEFAKELGVDFVYVSYNGLIVSLSSYYLNG